MSPPPQLADGWDEASLEDEDHKPGCEEEDEGDDDEGDYDEEYDSETDLSEDYSEDDLPCRAWPDIFDEGTESSVSPPRSARSSTQGNSPASRRAASSRPPSSAAGACGAEALEYWGPAPTSPEKASTGRPASPPGPFVSLGSKVVCLSMPPACTAEEDDAQPAEVPIAEGEGLPSDGCPTPRQVSGQGGSPGGAPATVVPTPPSVRRQGGRAPRRPPSTSGRCDEEASTTLPEDEVATSTRSAAGPSAASLPKQLGPSHGQNPTWQEPGAAALGEDEDVDEDDEEASGFFISAGKMEDPAFDLPAEATGPSAPLRDYVAATGELVTPQQDVLTREQDYSQSMEARPLSPLIPESGRATPQQQPEQAEEVHSPPLREHRLGTPAAEEASAAEPAASQPELESDEHAVVVPQQQLPAQEHPATGAHEVDMERLLRAKLDAQQVLMSVVLKAVFAVQTAQATAREVPEADPCQAVQAGPEALLGSCSSCASIEAVPELAGRRLGGLQDEALPCTPSSPSSASAEPPGQRSSANGSPKACASPRQVEGASRRSVAHPRAQADVKGSTAPAGPGRAQRLVCTRRRGPATQARAPRQPPARPERRPPVPRAQRPSVRKDTQETLLGSAATPESAAQKPEQLPKSAPAEGNAQEGPCYEVSEEEFDRLMHMGALESLEMGESREAGGAGNEYYEISEDEFERLMQAGQLQELVPQEDEEDATPFQSEGKSGAGSVSVEAPEATKPACNPATQSCATATRIPRPSSDPLGKRKVGFPRGGAPASQGSRSRSTQANGGRAASGSAAEEATALPPISRPDQECAKGGPPRRERRRRPQSIGCEKEAKSKAAFSNLFFVPTDVSASTASARRRTGSAARDPPPGSFEAFATTPLHSTRLLRDVPAPLTLEDLHSPSLWRQSPSGGSSSSSRPTPTAGKLPHLPQRGSPHQLPALGQRRPLALVAS